MKTLLKSLKTAIFEVMETMFFHLPDAEENFLSSEGPDPVLSTIYIGLGGEENNYILTFIFNRELAGSMAYDLLGIDESELENEIIGKCLKETANIYAGKFMLKLESKENLNITLPHNKKEDIFGPFETTAEESLTLSFNGYSLNAVIENIQKVQ